MPTSKQTLDEIMYDTVLTSSLNLQENDSLLIRAESSYKEIAKKLKQKALELGIKKVRIVYDNLENIKRLIESGDIKKQEEHSNRLTSLLNDSTAVIRIDATDDLHYSINIDPEKVKNYNKKVNEPFKKIIKENIDKWIVVGYPCKAQANAMNISLEEYSSLLYNALDINREKIQKKAEIIKEIFDYANQVKIRSDNTNIKFSLKHRGGQICNEKKNMPDWELFYGPKKNSVFGTVYYSNNIFYKGFELKNFDLTFKNGYVISYNSNDKNTYNTLKSLLGIDNNGKIINKKIPKSNRYVGEFGIGLNPGIKKLTGNILFDEKKEYSVHLALGRSYPYEYDNGGGENKNADIHMDLTLDLENKGELYIIDKKGTQHLIQQNGNWCIENIKNILMDRFKEKYETKHEWIRKMFKNNRSKNTDLDKINHLNEIFDIPYNNSNNICMDYNNPEIEEELVA